MPAVVIPGAGVLGGAGAERRGGLRLPGSSPPCAVPGPSVFRLQHASGNRGLRRCRLSRTGTHSLVHSRGDARQASKLIYVYGGVGGGGHGTLPGGVPSWPGIAPVFPCWPSRCWVKPCRLCRGVGGARGTFPGWSPFMGWQCARPMLAIPMRVKPRRSGLHGLECQDFRAEFPL